MMSFNKGKKESLEVVLKGNAAFSFKVYKALRQEREGDLVFSPLMLQTALGLLYMGAADTTARQIESELQLPADRTLVQNGFKALNKYLKNIKHASLEMATRVFTPDGIRIEKDFYLTAGKAFDSEVKTMDFRSVEKTRDSVNTIIKKSTHNKIGHVLMKGSLEYWTRMLVVSAIHFSCKMEVPFLAVDTTSDLFYVSASDSRSVKIMHRMGDFRYGQFDELKTSVLEIPYRSPQLSLVLMLPYSIDGLSYLEERLHTVDLLSMLESMPLQRVLASVPSFKFDESHDYTDTFLEMGLSGLSNAQLGDLRGVADASPPLTLTLFMHKACFEVGEEGSDPLAAGIVRVQDIPGVKPKVFRADHPFIFAVLDNTSGAIIYLGHVSCHQRFNPQLLREQSAQRLSFSPTKVSV